jgi:uncharacterized protein (TIGR03086 family)
MDTREIPALHRSASAQFSTVVAGITGDQWDEPTPCSLWSVRDLLAHNVVENLWVPALMAGETVASVGDRFDGDVLGARPSRAWAATVDSANAAMEDEGAMERIVHLSFGDLPGAEYAKQRIVDLVVHAWDLARATGRPEVLDGDSVHACLGWGEEWKPMLGAMGDYFDPPIESAPDADPQTRMLNLFGRHP